MTPNRLDLCVLQLLKASSQVGRWAVESHLARHLLVVPKEEEEEDGASYQWARFPSRSDRCQTTFEHLQTRRGITRTKIFHILLNLALWPVEN